MTNSIVYPDPKVESRRQMLIVKRAVAVANRDWHAMNEITKRLAKLPAKTSTGYDYSV